MATVLKAEQAERNGAKPRFFDLNDIAAEAERILADARAEAQCLVAHARQEADCIKLEATEEARREGYDQGRDEGCAAGRREAFDQAKQEFQARQADLIRAMQQTIKQFDEHKHRLISTVHRDLVELAAAIARRVAKRMGPLDRGMAVENLKEVIDHVAARSDLVVRISPKDEEAIRLFVEGLAKDQEEYQHVRVLADEKISPGGCILTTAEGQIDATIETQLDRLTAELVGVADDGESKP